MPIVAIKSGQVILWRFLPSAFRYQHFRQVAVASASAPSTAYNSKAEAKEECEKCFKRLDLTFENTKEAFKVEPVVSKMSRFGVKAILDYSVESDISQEEAEEKAVQGKVSDDQIPEAITALSGQLDPKSVETTHKQFNVHAKFGDRRLGVVSARTYFYSSEHECDKNADVFRNCIDAVATTTDGRGFTAVKITALGRPQLLLKLSETIAHARNFFKTLTGSTWENLVLSKISREDLLRRLKDFGIKADSKLIEEWFKMIDFDADGFVDVHDWGNILEHSRDFASMFQIINVKTGKLEPLIPKLSSQENQEFTNMMQRLIDVAEHARSRGVRIMIDAEQTYFQPAISRLAVALMRKYNQDGGFILNTYQAYLKSALNDIETDMHLAKRENFHFGCKLVRGAYMDQERRRAKEVGYDDPINPTYEATNDMYHRCLTRIADEHDARGLGKVSVMVASHNEETVRYAVNLMKEREIAPSQRVICFAQLYGMCDQVSFSLGQAGYSIYKYLPYGPVEEVLPYLSRRALENGGMLKKVQKERSLLWTELKRRLASGQMVYTVPTKNDI